MTLLYLVATWTAGLFLVPDHATTGWWLLLAGGGLVLAIWQRRTRARRLSLLCVMMFALGAARYAYAARPLGPDDIGSYTDMGYTSLTGIISRDPDERDSYVNLTIDAQTVTIDNIARTVEGTVLVQAPRFGTYAYGDRIRARGFLLTPPEYDDFSYRDYLAHHGIYALLANAEVDHLSSNQGNSWLAALYRLKSRALHTIDRLLPSPEAPLLSGILLGVESSIPASVSDNFNITGTSHIIAISGSNIIIVIQVLLILLTPIIGKRYARLTTILGIASYTALVGANAAVVRAAIMGSLTLMAMQSGRRAHGLTSLAFSAWLMTLWNPFTLWDIGFQLSVSAVLGLIVLTRPLTTQFERILQRGFAESTTQTITRRLSEPLIVSLAAQITTTPLILVYFKRFSLISLLANLLIVPVQPFIMILGWVAVAVGIVWQPIGELFAWVAWLPLTYTLRIVDSLAGVKWAALDVHLETSYAWLIYGLLAGFAWLTIQHPDDRAALLRRLSQRAVTLVLLIGAVVLAVLVWLTALSQPDGKLHVWFLDVGHGHAVLIQTPQGAQILVDGGPNPSLLRQAVGDALPFWDHTLDMLIVSQPDSSTTNALPTLLDRYDVSLVLTNGQADDNNAYLALQRIWQTRHIQVIPVSAGYNLQTGDGVTLEILHPQTPPAADDDPKDSALVVRVRYGDASFLITNDLTPEAEETLTTAGWYIGSTVLELPSHGSAKANSPQFIARANPQIAVVGIGAGNRSTLPAPEVDEQIRTLTGYPIYRTDRHGTVEITTDGSTLQLSTRD